jgi:hypothetical protein
MGWFRKRLKRPEQYPQIGITHKNGDRLFGVDMPYAADLMRQGTPKVSSLQKSTVTELIREVQMHDELWVAWDGRHWWASSSAGRVGRLTWLPNSKGRPDPRSGVPMHDLERGVLHVKTITIDVDGVVVDVGGYVVPDVS